MLGQFIFSNYKSFKEEAFLDFFAEPIRDNKQSIIIDKIDGEKFLPAIVIYGPNGGGKSTVLEALIYLRSLVLRPFLISQMPDNEEYNTIIKKPQKWVLRKNIINLLPNIKINQLNLILCFVQKVINTNINFHVSTMKL